MRTGHPAPNTYFFLQPIIIDLWQIRIFNFCAKFMGQAELNSLYFCHLQLYANFTALDEQ